VIALVAAAAGVTRVPGGSMLGRLPALNRRGARHR
jgi:hypothetical protein